MTRIAVGAPRARRRRRRQRGTPRRHVAMGLSPTRAETIPPNGWTPPLSRCRARGGAGGSGRPSRRLLLSLCGRRLEVALEATTGWRVSGRRSCAGSAGGGALWPSRRRPPLGAGTRSAPTMLAPTPQHVRNELSRAGRAAGVMEAPTDHILDSGARSGSVRAGRYEQHTEWQQRIEQAVLYHHEAVRNGAR